MNQKQISFLNNLIILISIIFIIIFFVPIFMINLPLDYQINDNNLVIDAKDLNMQKHLFIEIKNNNIATITHKEANLKIDKSNIKDNQIILDIGKLNIDKNLKIYYGFKKSIISYILKKNVFN
ncbi:MAG: hypothetical protein LBC22_03370 [Endomicrobium sp.]|nr:hypothetical protein [Endomicrobium sp.]